MLHPFQWNTREILLLWILSTIFCKSWSCNWAFIQIGAFHPCAPHHAALIARAGYKLCKPTYASDAGWCRASCMYGNGFAVSECEWQGRAERYQWVRARSWYARLLQQAAATSHHQWSRCRARVSLATVLNKYGTVGRSCGGGST